MNFEETEYLNQLKDCLENGETSNDRTETGTIRKTGVTLRFNLEKSFPLLTTKKMFSKGAICEILWFLKGQTDAKILEEQGVKIWSGNSSRQALDKLGFFGRDIGDIGESYGFNFRYYNSKYINCYTDYSNQGFDQVNYVINLIKNDNSTRRAIINLWNPSSIDNCCLPPCCFCYQFLVNNGKLSCVATQRSADSFLGLPFNFITASLLTHIIAFLTNLKVGELIFNIADFHIYKTHIEQVKEQISREPFSFPQLIIKDRGQKTVEDFCVGDFSFDNYKCYPSIKAVMSV